MPNKQKKQNYDYFDFLDFKDRSDRDRLAIQPQDRDPLFFGSRSGPKIAIRLISDRDLGSDRDPKKIWIAIAIRSRTPTLKLTEEVR
jgi:hypothetical protein